jgi:signal transduction histidine kinase
MEDTRYRSDMDDYTSQIPTAQQLIEQEAELSSQRQPDLDALQRVLAELDHTKELLHNEVAARQRAEHELRKAKDITTATLQVRENFLATMSHELRTPLSIVIGYTDLLKDSEFGDLSEQQVAILHRVKKNAGDLLALIEALLDASRLQLGRASASVTKVRFGEVLEAVWEETKELRGSSPLQFIYDVQDADAVFYTDVDKFKVIVRNLISNARKFTEHGQVTLRARRGGGGVEVQIIDTGIGIVAEEIPFIFVPFRKVGTALTRNKSGTGLGLYVVKSFVDLLRGTITVESEIGRGSTFRVWLPMALR